MWLPVAHSARNKSHRKKRKSAINLGDAMWGKLNKNLAYFMKKKQFLIVSTFVKLYS